MIRWFRIAAMAPALFASAAFAQIEGSVTDESNNDLNLAQRCADASG
jgi:hypothetical protein